jgi:hypothetical protein
MFTGGCLCGAVRYRVSGAPVYVTHCHCSMCRRAVGAVVVTWATVRNQDFAFTKGEPARFRSSPAAERGFCPTCGTSLTFRHDDYPAEIDITVASLDNPEAVPPRDHIWTRSKVSWLRLDDHLPRLERDHSSPPDTG